LHLGKKVRVGLPGIRGFPDLRLALPVGEQQVDLGRDEQLLACAEGVGVGEVVESRERKPQRSVAEFPLGDLGECLALLDGLDAWSRLLSLSGIHNE
jgi:hypothetical protein